MAQRYLVTNSKKARLWAVTHNNKETDPAGF